MATRAPERADAAPPRRPAGKRRPTGRHWRHAVDVKASPYAYVAPFFLLFCAFGLFPIGYTLWVSLHEWTLLDDEHTFLGLENFRVLLTDSYFWNATYNTLSIGILSMVPQLLLALWLAHLLNRPLRAQNFFRITLLLPNVTSVVAVVVIFSQIFGRDFGLINWVITSFGGEGIAWRDGSLSSHLAISTMIMWRWTGYNALILLAAMQAVPRELYEAATIDGASSFTQLRKVTVPMIRPTIAFVVITSTIGSMQIFAEPLLFGAYTLTGGQDRQYQTLSLFFYENYMRLDFGYSSAISWMIFVFILIIAGVNYLLTSRMKGNLR